MYDEPEPTWDDLEFPPDAQRYRAHEELDAQWWLALDEGDRQLHVRCFHASDEAGHEQPESPRLHASMHVVVENQLAEAWVPAVEAFDRLRVAGVTRHDAVHALGSVVALGLWRVQNGQEWSTEVHVEELQRLDVLEWLSGPALAEARKQRRKRRQARRRQRKKGGGR